MNNISCHQTNIISISLLLICCLALFPNTIASKSQVFNYSSEKRGEWRTSCPHVQIQVSQGDESSVGIPRFSVMIVNLCTDCWVARVHLHCGWFASANVVNPNDFKRIDYDNCLVYGGRPIPGGHAIEFQYSNTFPYPLSVASFVCWP
ncbi:hypothetical protein ABFX02_11G028900 [Erythranthe guttata]